MLNALVGCVQFDCGKVHGTNWETRQASCRTSHGRIRFGADAVQSLRGERVHDVNAIQPVSSMPPAWACNRLARSYRPSSPHYPPPRRDCWTPSTNRRGVDHCQSSPRLLRRKHWRSLSGMPALPFWTYPTIQCWMEAFFGEDWLQMVFVGVMADIQAHLDCLLACRSWVILGIKVFFTELWWTARPSASRWPVFWILLWMQLWNPLRSSSPQSGHQCTVPSLGGSIWPTLTISTPLMEESVTNGFFWRNHDSLSCTTSSSVALCNIRHFFSQLHIIHAPITNTKQHRKKEKKVGNTAETVRMVVMLHRCQWLETDPFIQNWLGFSWNEPFKTLQKKNTYTHTNTH